MRAQTFDIVCVRLQRSALRNSILIERLVPAFGYIFAQRLVNAGYMTMQPETVEFPTRLKVATGFNRMSEDTPISVRPAVALPVMRKIFAA